MTTQQGWKTKKKKKIEEIRIWKNTYLNKYLAQLDSFIIFLHGTFSFLFFFRPITKHDGQQHTQKDRPWDGAKFCVNVDHHALKRFFLQSVSQSVRLSQSSNQVFSS